MNAFREQKRRKRKERRGRGQEKGERRINTLKMQVCDVQEVKKNSEKHIEMGY